MDQQNNAQHNLIYVIVRNREKILLQERCKALSSLNEKGPFDVLPEHINFLSVVTNYIKLHKIDGTTAELKINQGIMEVKNNTASVFLDVSPLPTQPPAQKK